MLVLRPVKNISLILGAKLEIPSKSNTNLQAGANALECFIANGYAKVHYLKDRRKVLHSIPKAASDKAHCCAIPLRRCYPLVLRLAPQSP